MHRAAAELLGYNEERWQGWRRCDAGDSAQTATNLLEVFEIIASRLHNPSAPVHPWKRRGGGGGAPFEEDDEIHPHYLVRGWFGTQADETAFDVELAGKQPDVRWVSEDVLLQAVERRHLDPECDSSLLELLTNYNDVAVCHTLERACALGIELHGEASVRLAMAVASNVATDVARAAGEAAREALESAATDATPEAAMAAAAAAARAARPEAARAARAAAAVIFSKATATLSVPAAPAVAASAGSPASGKRPAAGRGSSGSGSGSVSGRRVTPRAH